MKKHWLCRLGFHNYQLIEKNEIGTDTEEKDYQYPHDLGGQIIHTYFSLLYQCKRCGRKVTHSQSEREETWYK
jgi:hypothetical protein